MILGESFSPAWPFTTLLHTHPADVLERAAGCSGCPSPSGRGSFKHSLPETSLSCCAVDRTSITGLATQLLDSALCGWIASCVLLKGWSWAPQCLLEPIWGVLEPI